MSSVAMDLLMAEETKGKEKSEAMENGVYPVVTEPIYDGYCDLVTIVLV